MEKDRQKQTREQLEQAKAKATDPKIKEAIQSKLDKLGKDVCK